MNSIIRLITFALATTPLISPTEQAKSRQSTEKSVRQWIADLDSDDYAARQSAVRELVRAGSVAVPAVRNAAASSSLEVVVRSVRILSRMTLTGDAATKRLAHDALTRLAASSDRRVAYRATHEISRQQRRFIAQLKSLGASANEAPGPVTTISFNGSKVKDDDLSILRHFPDVVSLSLSSTKIGDVGMKHVASLKKLERLDLYRSQVGNEGLKHIKTLRNLTSLPMGETKVTDAGLVHLRHMTQLEYLGLRGDNITDAGLVHLKLLTNLTGLYLGETKVTDTGLPHISHMKKMQYLRLDTVRVTDAGLVHLRGMTQLTRIDVYDTGISDQGVQRLKKWFPNCNVVKTK